jgi:hypothetical protein
LCTVPNYIGVTGTPLIDPATDILYMFAKGYEGNAASGGVALGRYWAYALQLPSLADVTGFPLLIDGHNADNDLTRYFVGGTVLQRPSLTTLNGVVIAAFGGHCDLFNYTGYVVANIAHLLRHWKRTGTRQRRRARQRPTSSDDARRMCSKPGCVFDGEDDADRLF